MMLKTIATTMSAHLTKAAEAQASASDIGTTKVFIGSQPVPAELKK